MKKAPENFSEGLIAQSGFFAHPTLRRAAEPLA